MKKNRIFLSLFFLFLPLFASESQKEVPVIATTVQTPIAQNPQRQKIIQSLKSEADFVYLCGQFLHADISMFVTKDTLRWLLASNPQGQFEIIRQSISKAEVVVVNFFEKIRHLYLKLSDEHKKGIINQSPFVETLFKIRHDYITTISQHARAKTLDEFLESIGDRRFKNNFIDEIENYLAQFPQKTQLFQALTGNSLLTKEQIEFLQSIKPYYQKYQEEHQKVKNIESKKAQEQQKGQKRKQKKSKKKKVRQGKKPVPQQHKKIPTQLPISVPRIQEGSSTASEKVEEKSSSTHLKAREIDKLIKRLNNKLHELGIDDEKVVDLSPDVLSVTVETADKTRYTLINATGAPVLHPDETKIVYDSRVTRWHKNPEQAVKTEHIPAHDQNRVIELHRVPRFIVSYFKHWGIPGTFRDKQNRSIEIVRHFFCEQKPDKEKQWFESVSGFLPSNKNVCYHQVKEHIASGEAILSHLQEFPKEFTADLQKALETIEESEEEEEETT